MSNEELKSVYYISKEIEMWEQELKELKSKSLIASPDLNNCPNGKTGDKVANLAIQIAFAEEKIKNKIEELAVAKAKIDAFLASVSDEMVRMIIYYRFEKLLSWEGVAIKIGGNNTENSVKKRYYRYIKSNSPICPE